MNNFSEQINIVLGLITIFQWLDRRSKNQSIEKTLHATFDMSHRMEEMKGSPDLIEQKSKDICGNLDAVIQSVGGISPLQDGQKKVKKGGDQT